MLNREENQKAVDGASQVISVTEGGSCRKASTQGRAADPGFRVWEMVRGRGVGGPGQPVRPKGALQLRSLWSCSQASRGKVASQILR